VVDALGRVVDVARRTGQLVLQLVGGGMDGAGDTGPLPGAGFLLLLGEMRRAFFQGLNSRGRLFTCSRRFTCSLSTRSGLFALGHDALPSKF
jgi:hypothetical protein